MGEVLRQGGADEDRVKAEQLYRRAVVALETYAEPYKALGLLYMKQGKKQEAHEAWRRYLLLAPQAPDRKHVEHELQKGQP